MAGSLLVATPLVLIQAFTMDYYLVNLTTHATKG